MIVDFELASFKLGDDNSPNITHFIDMLVLDVDNNRIRFDLRNFKDYSKAQSFLTYCRLNKDKLLDQANRYAL